MKLNKNKDKKEKQKTKNKQKSSQKHLEACQNRLEAPRSLQTSNNYALMTGQFSFFLDKTGQITSVKCAPRTRIEIWRYKNSNV